MILLDSRAMPPAEGEQSPQTATIPARALEILGATGVLAAFGYMALRAHWNFLGVTSLAGVGTDRYLMETYSIVAGALLPALLLLLIAGAAAMAVRLCVRVAPVFARRAEGPLLRARPWIFLLLLVAAQFRMLQVFSRGGLDCSVDVALGDLQSKGRAGCFAQSDETVLFYGMAVLCIATLFLRGRAAARQQHAIWSAAAAAAVVVALQLPILYGRALKPPRYPAAAIATTSGDVKGLLVLQTANAVELWTVQNASGSMLVIPMGQVKSIRSEGLRNLLDVAQQAVKGPAAFDQSLGLAR
jgi:hypothetical protein